jgi:soluble lytic murein transglycosylase
MTTRFEQEGAIRVSARMQRVGGRWTQVSAVAVLAVALVCSPSSSDDRLAGGEAASAQGDETLRAELADARAEFLEAWSRMESGASPTAAEDSDRLRGYPLYPYLEAARIARALGRPVEPDTAADAAAREFMLRHGDEPVAGQVRQALLESLARRDEWQRFLAERDSTGSDVALRCLTLRGRIALGDLQGIAPEIVDVWLTGRQLPLDCEPVFAWLRGEALLTDALIEQRVRLLLESGQAAFARVIAARLPAERAAPWLRWADLLERPRDTLDALIRAPSTPLPEGALDAGWRRLTRNQPDEALVRLERLIDAFELDPAAESRATLALALGLSWDRRAEALALFARVAPADLDDYALGWLTRAALWAGEWRLARDAIIAMSAEQRAETRWRYWAARAAEETGQRRAARALYRAILAADNYYSAMAAARLDEPVEPSQRTVRAEERRLARLASLAPFIRARELFFSRMPWLAAPEWRHGSAPLDAEDARQTIHLAMRWGWYDLGVATATSQRVFDDYRLLYPTPYDEPVHAAAALTKLEPALIYGVIRQESLYRSDAASSAGAIGLAQLQPDTARRAARRWSLPEPTRADLMVPSINVTLGAAELRSLVETFDGQLPVALAGYNAGPNAARRWLPDRPLDADVWIENIPYNETRSYVQRVLWHSLVFAWLESGDARDTRAWLAQIGPAAGSIALASSAAQASPARRATE